MTRDRVVARRRLHGDGKRDLHVRRAVRTGRCGEVPETPLWDGGSNPRVERLRTCIPETSDVGRLVAKRRREIHAHLDPRGGAGSVVRDLEDDLGWGTRLE